MHGFVQLFSGNNISFLLDGFFTTLRIALWTSVFSFPAGTILALVLVAGEQGLASWLSRVVRVYVEVFRNTPMLLVMLAMRLNTGLPPEWAAISGMTLFFTATMAEIARGGLLSLDRGQWEAAASQGFSYIRALWHVVMPQGFRRMIPPMVSQFTTILKDTAFAWALGIEEVTGRGVIVFSKYGNPMQTFAMIALGYFAVNYAVSIAARSVQVRLAVRSY